MADIIIKIREIPIQSGIHVYFIVEIKSVMKVHGE